MKNDKNEPGPTWENFLKLIITPTRTFSVSYHRILKGEVSLYCWPPVWPVWISLFCKSKQLLSVVIQLIPNQSSRRSAEQWYFPVQYSLLLPSLHAGLVAELACPKWSGIWMIWASDSDSERLGRRVSRSKPSVDVIKNYFLLHLRSSKIS